MDIGDWVRIKGEQGVFRVMRLPLEGKGDGSVSLYGGDKNPEGRRGYRAVMPARLVPTKAPYTKKGER